MANGNGLLSIGNFSLITRLSQKALRYYEERGILRPAKKEITGYRWYSFEQVGIGLLLRRLSDLGFSIEDMKEVLDAGSDSSRIDSIIERRIRSINEEVRSLEAIRGSLEHGKIIEVFEMRNEEPTMKEIPTTRVISKTDKGTYAEVTPRLIGELFSMLMGPQNRGARIAGPPMAIYHDEEYKEADATIEIAVPITGRIEVGEGFEVKTVPALQVMSAIHKGPFNEVGPTWARLFKYLDQKGIKPTGQARELYLSDPQTTPQSDLLTEIQVPIG